MAESRLIDTVLGSVRVQVRGSGEAMMFWPSLLMTGDMWAAQADHFGTDHRVILVDPLGFGESQKLTAPFTFEDCARCIVDILDGLGVHRTHFVGNSWGGLRMAGLLGGIRPPLTRSVLKAFLGPTTFTTRPDVVAFVRDSVQRVDVRSGGWAVRSVVPARPDQRALLSRVTTPVLVIAGVEDATFPLPETIAVAEAIPGAAVVVLEGVAHLAALENPAVVNTLIGEFVLRG